MICTRKNYISNRKLLNSSHALKLRSINNFQKFIFYKYISMNCIAYNFPFRNSMHIYIISHNKLLLRNFKNVYTYSGMVNNVNVLAAY